MVIYQGARGQGKLPLKRTQPERRRDPKPSSASQASQRSAHLHGDLLSLAQRHHGLTIDLGLTQPGAWGGERQWEARVPWTQPLLQGTRWGQEADPIVPPCLACCVTLAHGLNLPEPCSFQ